MTDIDPSSDIDLRTTNEHVIARVPLTGLVTDEWLRCYERLAHASGVPVQAQADADRAWIVVNVPAGENQSEVAATMDVARALIAETDAAARTPTTPQAEGTVRDWWTRRRASASREPISRIEIARTGLGVEKPWPLLIALAPAIAIPLLLPSRFSLGPSWIVPVVLAVLLMAIVAADRARGGRRRVAVRALSLALVAVLIAEAAGVTARLIADLVEGGPETNSATDLLSVGFGVWVYAILAFAFLYWIVDGGGPDARLWAPPEYPNLAFPEQLNPGVAPPGWRPQFLRLRLPRLYQRDRIQPDRCDAPRPLGEGGNGDTSHCLSRRIGAGDRPGCQHLAVTVWVDSRRARRVDDSLPILRRPS